MREVVARADDGPPPRVQLRPGATGTQPRALGYQQHQLRRGAPPAVGRPSGECLFSLGHPQPRPLFQRVVRPLFGARRPPLHLWLGKSQVRVVPLRRDVCGCAREFRWHPPRPAHPRRPGAALAWLCGWLAALRHLLSQAAARATTRWAFCRERHRRGVGCGHATAATRGLRRHRPPIAGDGTAGDGGPADRVPLGGPLLRAPEPHLRRAGLARWLQAAVARPLAAAARDGRGRHRPRRSRQPGRWTAGGAIARAPSWAREGERGGDRGERPEHG